MLRNNESFLCDVIGMPDIHKQAFMTVAHMLKCVIMVRATGPTCHGLLEEGYATKGYRIHGKSCDWGPMAGFVLRDPRLNKYGAGKAEFNRDKHQEAISDDHEGQGWKASTIPLKISMARYNWLVGHNKIATVIKGDRFDGEATHPTGIRFKYSLIKEADGLLGVYFDNTDPMRKWVQEKGTAVAKYHPKYGQSYEPMLAVTNPPGYGKADPLDYKNAITGDYDLFAVWPFNKSVLSAEHAHLAHDASTYGLDHRPLGTVRGSNSHAERENVEELERHFTNEMAPGGQGTKLGNITARIYEIGQTINSLVGNHVIWHSDEAARPFLDDVDLPVIAFMPDNITFLGIRDIPEFKRFIHSCEAEGIVVNLSNAWAQNATDKKPNRLGEEYSRYVPADGERILVPGWYNG